MRTCTCTHNYIISERLEVCPSDCSSRQWLCQRPTIISPNHLGRPQAPTSSRRRARHPGCECLLCHPHIMDTVHQYTRSCATGGRSLSGMFTTTIIRSRHVSLGKISKIGWCTPGDTNANPAISGDGAVSAFVDPGKPIHERLSSCVIQLSLWSKLVMMCLAPFRAIPQARVRGDWTRSTVTGSVASSWGTSTSACSWISPCWFSSAASAESPLVDARRAWRFRCPTASWDNTYQEKPWASQNICAYALPFSSIFVNVGNGDRRRRPASP